MTVNRINVVDKGKEGEREVCRLLKSVIDRMIAENRYDEETVTLLQAAVQRNQNQSAVGGGDINLLGLSIEVKRCETIEVEKWWRQATVSAARNNDKPVLMYRQNNKRWHVVIDGYMPLPTLDFLGARVTINLDAFLEWFEHWAADKIREGALVRV